MFIVFGVKILERRSWLIPRVGQFIPRSHVRTCSLWVLPLLVGRSQFQFKLQCSPYQCLEEKEQREHLGLVIGVSRKQLARVVSLEQVTERRQHNGGAASAARNARERPIDLDQAWKPDRLEERTTVIGGIAAWSRWRGAELHRWSI